MRSRLVAWILAAFVAVIATAACDSKPDEQGGRSGFWTSRQPATNGPYRWRLLAVGVGLVLITGTTTIVLVRRAGRRNDGREPKRPWDKT